MTTEEQPVCAIIGRVIRPQGKTAYVVTYPIQGERIPVAESITFALTVWAGATEPTPGQYVRLNRINRHRRGLRAEYAEPNRV